MNFPSHLSILAEFKPKKETFSLAWTLSEAKYPGLRISEGVNMSRAQRPTRNNAHAWMTAPTILYTNENKGGHNYSVLQKPSLPGMFPSTPGLFHNNILQVHSQWFLLFKNSFPLSVYPIFFTHTFYGGHLGCLCVLAVGSNVALQCPCLLPRAAPEPP